MKSLLVLEKDLEGREILSKMLRQRGFHVVPVEHESTALAVLDEGIPVDLVLTGAADHDRLAFLAALRRQRPSLPVVFLADYRDDEVKWHGLLNGFLVSPRYNVYINTRPIQFHELDRLIRIVPNPTQNRHEPLRNMHSEVA